MENAYLSPWQGGGGGVTQRLLTAPVALYLLQRLPPEPKSSGLASCYQTCTYSCHGEGDQQRSNSPPPLSGEDLSRRKSRVLTLQRCTEKACGRLPILPLPSALLSFPFLSLTISPSLSFSSIQVLPLFLFFISLSPFFLFSPSVLQGDTMGRVGQSENTWIQVLPLLTPAHVS